MNFRSDNTSQHAGNVEGVCNSVTFYPPRTASVAISIASKMFLTAIKITTWIPSGGKVREGLESYGPFGKPSGPLRGETFKFCSNQYFFSFVRSSQNNSHPYILQRPLLPIRYSLDIWLYQARLYFTFSDFVICIG